VHTEDVYKCHNLEAMLLVNTGNEEGIPKMKRTVGLMYQCQVTITYKLPALVNTEG
jgi:hypothetical protein